MYLCTRLKTVLSGINRLSNQIGSSDIGYTEHIAVSRYS